MEPRELIRRARELRATPTDAESRLWYYLRNDHLGVRFRFQCALFGYIPDFVCFSHRLIVEVDGGHHLGRSSYDQARSQHLERQGFKVLRFWDGDVLERTHDVLEAIRHAIAERLQCPRGVYKP